MGKETKEEGIRYNKKKKKSIPQHSLQKVWLQASADELADVSSSSPQIEHSVDAEEEEESTFLLMVRNLAPLFGTYEGSQRLCETAVYGVSMAVRCRDAE